MLELPEGTAVTGRFWLLALALGATGGAFNALLSDRARLLPSLITLSPGGSRVVRIGLVGNVLIGLAMAASLCWAVEAAGATLGANGGRGFALLGLCNLFIAFVSARWVTNEVDKLVLRKAVFKAASAPAAHPDVVGEMELAPTDALYALVDRLLPRRAGHR
jgi:hypothetical protein